MLFSYLEFVEGEETIDIEEREKERERGSNLRRQRLASPTAQVLVAQTTQPAEWSERLTSRQSGWLGVADRGSIPSSLFLSFFNVYLEFHGKAVYLPADRPCRQTLSSQKTKVSF